MKLLFTPGPLTTSETVKQAMLRDLGSRDDEFIAIVRGIRRDLLSLCGPGAGDYEAIPMQGSGTFAIESAISSAVPRNGSLLVLVNGVYGRRMARIAEVHGIECRQLVFAENEPVDPAAVREELARVSATHVAVVHCETTTGMMNPVEQIGALVREAGVAYIVDAMSSFGGIPLDVGAAGIDFLVSSANKCIEGVPGFGFVIARRPALEGCRGQARTLSLDLYEQWAGLERDGQFRFTPPTHALLAFRQALDELAAEGGVTGRAARYQSNADTLVAGMRELGFETWLRDEHRSAIITTFRYPDDPGFSFEALYKQLSDAGFVIYPGKLTAEGCFRIGSIGHITEKDIRALLSAWPGRPQSQPGIPLRTQAGK
jgi:2-aminoethylphosphonate-pyruvate transaminase